MLKMYHRHAESGASAAYWEDFGSAGSLDDRLRFCDVDPLRPLFVKHLAPGSTMLEGGCGRGQYVAYYAARGVEVVGLDFAREWLTAIRKEGPALMLCAGDVAALPFRDGAFDLYYSGGVVEHFEQGAHHALAEARRVLKDNGILLISVPYYSPMRRALVLARRGEWRRVRGPELDNGAAAGRRFYQYAYTVREFSDMLVSAGLRVVGTQGYAIAWGLYDVDTIRGVMEWLQRGRTTRSRPSPAVASRRTSTHGAAPAPSLLKRLFVAEDTTVPGAGWLVKAARWGCANMMMYVCTPDAGAAA
jgi:SAM-dependent methyltransferase